MKLISLLTVSALAASHTVAAFSVVEINNRVARASSSSSVSSTRLASSTAEDIEALLEKARQLKAEAAAAEQELHKEQLEKKQCKDSDLDDCIDKLFPRSDASVEGLAQRLRDHHWSTDKLLSITKRIHEREIHAQGKGHVTASLHHDHTKFERVSSGDAHELARVQGLIDRLLEAAELIDEEYMAEKRKAKEQKYLSHVDLDHWTMGDLAGNLRRQVGELRREHEEQFQERLESFYEAQRKEKLHSTKKKKQD